jgi:uncharacterized protein (TIGR03067 family)
MAIMELETTVHPRDDKLGDFFHGRLPADEAAVVEEHLADCERCCLLVENVPNDSFMRRLRAARALPSVDTQVDLASNTLLEEPGELANHPRYRVVRPLGRGGMGAVYLAEHLRMGRSVALKVINPELLNHGNALSRFQQEVKAAAKLDHPNIVAAYDADQAGSLHFLVMEYVEGQNLADYLNEKGPLPIAQACDIIRQAALGLQHAHERGMVHRDIKPHNLMLTPSGQVKVLDFGLARFAADPAGATTDDESTTAPHLTGAGAVMGSADYIAPEQARDAHSADGRSDIYSLGCTLYHLLTGRPPFPEGTAPEKLQRHSVDNPRPLSVLRPEAPDGLAKVIAKTMAKKPDDRYQSAADVATALSPFTKYVKPRRFKIGRVLLAIAGLALAVFSLVVAAGIVRIPLGNDRELVIETDVPDIVVIVKGERIVRIVDPKTGQAYQLDRDDLTLARTDDPDGLCVRLDGEREVVLRREGRRIVTIRLESKKDNPELVADRIREVRRFEGAPGKCIFGLAISRDGRRLLLTNHVPGPGWRQDPSNNLRLFDLNTGKQLVTFENSAKVLPVAITPDSKTVITGGDQNVRIWDLSKGKVVSEWKTGDQEHSWEGQVFSVAFSPDGKYAFSASFNGDVVKWELATGKSVSFFRKAIIPSMALSANGQRLAFIAEPLRSKPGDGIIRVRVFDATSAKELCTIPTSNTAFGGVCLTPDGRQLAWGHADGTIRVWDVQADREAMQLPFVKGEIQALAFSPDGKRLLATTSAGFMRLWDARTSKPLDEYTAPSGVRAVAFTPDGQHVVTGNYDGIGRLYRLPDLPSEKVGEVRRFSEGLQKQAWRHRAAFTADGQGVYASSGAYPLAVMHWDRHTGALISRFDIDSSPNAFSLSPDRKLMVFSGAEGGLQVAEAAFGKLPSRLEGAKGVIWCSAVAPASDRVAIGDECGKVHVWDRPSGKLLWSKQVELRPVRGLAISPDGKTLATGGNSPSVLLCEVATGKEIRRFGKAGCIECAFSSDGKRLVVGGGGEVLIWDLAANKVVHRIGPLPAALDAMALAPDEKHLATGTYDGMVRWWDIDTGAELQCFHAHPGGVLGVAVSPDGKELLSSGKDGTVRLWRLPGSPAPEKVQGGPVEKRLKEAAKSNDELAVFLKVCEAPHPSLPEKFGAAQEKPGAADYLKLQGAWTMTSVNGPPGLPKDFPPRKLVIVGDQFVQRMGGKEVRSTFKLNPQKDPKEIDLYQGSQLGVRGIYRFKGDEFHLLICVGIIVGEGETAMVILDRRPANFTAPGAVSMVFKRLRSPDSSAEELKQPLPGSEAARPALPAKDARATGPRQIALEVTLAQMEPAEARRLFGRQTKNDPLILGVRNDKAGQMLRMREKAKILAEAHLVALNGRPGKFTSGGIVVDFLPIVLDNGKIHLEVCPEISVPDAAAGVRMGGPTSALVPGFKTQRAEVTAQLEDGQTLVIGGLAATMKNAKQAEQELVILATPRLEKTSTVEKAEPGEGGAK